MRKLSIAVVGLGGFGINYVKALLSEAEHRNVEFVAGVDPSPERCSALADIQRREIPLYRSLGDYLTASDAPDLIAFATPLQLHCEHVVQALKAGSHVICEKPAAACPDQIGKMIRAREAAGKIVAIGYQWSFAAATQRLKRDIIAGRFGRPRRMATLTCWPRDSRYYARNNWAGRVHDDAGRVVLDSPANNACAHFLHNMFYLLGNTHEGCAMPLSVTAELYRAYPIQNYDTAAIRASAAGGAELLFLASHATENNHDTVCRFEFEHATVHYGNGPEDRLRVRFNNGQTEEYGPLPGGDSMDKLWSVVDSIRCAKPMMCGLEASAAQTMAVWAAQHSVTQVSEFPAAFVSREEEVGRYRLFVRGLEETLHRCYGEFGLPSETGVAWARAGKPTRCEPLDIPRREVQQPKRQTVGV